MLVLCGVACIALALCAAMCAGCAASPARSVVAHREPCPECPECDECEECAEAKAVKKPCAMVAPPELPHLVWADATCPARFTACLDPIDSALLQRFLRRSQRWADDVLKRCGPHAR